MKKFLIPVVAFAAMSFAACSSNSNTNKTFVNFAPTSKPYKQALAKVLTTTSPADLTFTFNQCLSVSGKDYIDVSIHGKGINAKSLILVNNWNKLENLKHTNGIGYSGAELKNLQIEVINNNNEPAFIYKGLDKIVD